MKKLVSLILLICLGISALLIWDGYNNKQKLIKREALTYYEVQHCIELARSEFDFKSVSSFLEIQKINKARLAKLNLSEEYLDNIEKEFKASLYDSRHKDVKLSCGLLDSFYQ